MIYVMADIHGDYKAYFEMLQRINFSSKDQLYIIGDVLDRGSAPIEILLDIMQRDNVKLLAGNHEVMALECLKFLQQEITEDMIDNMDSEMVSKFIDWIQNGGMSTADSYHKCSQSVRKKIVEYLSEIELYKEIVVSEKKYILVHAGLGNFRPDKKLCEYSLDELVWERVASEQKYYEDCTVIVGHTPTQLIDENEKPGYIFKTDNIIFIDTGSGFSTGRLSCLCLDTMEEFYVKSI